MPSATLPADARPAPPGCADQVLAAGWVAAENAKRGSRPLPQTGRSQVDPVLGYLSSTSVGCGQELTVHLAGPRQQVQLVAWRLGDYGGVGSRFVWQSGDVAVEPRPTPAPEPGTRLVAPAWPASYSVHVSVGWPPGMYALQPVSPDGRGAVGPSIPLVVRHDGGHEPVLAMASTLTWNAYSTWGGWSLYLGRGRTHAEQVADRARVVALQRPLTGSGHHQWTAMDVPLAQWVESVAVAEKTGLDVAWVTDVDLDARPSLVLDHAELLTGGHPEYWTRRMYDTLEAALGRGVNVAMLGGNTVWWQARVEGDGTREVVYRDAAEDPVSATDPQLTTVLWNRAPLRRPWAAVSGQSRAGVGVRGGLQLLRPPSWLVAGTTLTDGSLLPGAVGNEAEGFNPTVVRPADLQVVAVGVLLGRGGPFTVSSNYVTTPSGSALFTAGTTLWACRLLPDCPDGDAPAATRDALRALSRNVVLALSRPGAGTREPAMAVLPPSAAVLATTLAAAARGGYGEDSD